jgi:hypothetical protein
MYELLKKILSDKSKNRIFLFFIKIIRRKLVDVENRIPKYTLSQKHLNSLKALENRKALLELLPKNGIVAELGVNKGDFSRQIIDICQPKKLHLVDIWNSERYHMGLKLEIENKFSSEFEKGQMIINYGLSTDVAGDFQNEYFDWIYIDTEHTYKCTIAELEKYAPKIKPGGIIAGHDYMMGNWTNLVRYGVIEAVYEFCFKNNWEIIYITMDIQEYQSFAIKKIQN